MKRRKFVTASLTAGSLPFGIAAQANVRKQAQKEWYELRTYEIRFGGNQSQLLDYLNQALKPAVTRAGANRFMLFRELGQSEPTKVWLWISYPDIGSYQSAQDLSGDKDFQQAAEFYNNLSVDQTIYNRYGSWLLNAFDGLPQAIDPVEDASLFELRTYEGYSEDAVRRKIKMFNVEELELFYKVKLNPLFFGEMIAGPYRPCLTYMINFKDMASHDASWKAFLEHPEWIKMRDKAEYANSVSNIRKTFLEPV